MQPSSGRESSHCYSNLMRCDPPEPERHSLDICWSCSEGRADQPQHPEAFPRWHSKGRRHSAPARCIERAGDCFLRQNEPRLGPKGGRVPQRGSLVHKGAEGPLNQRCATRCFEGRELESVCSVEDGCTGAGVSSAYSTEPYA
jgi:hypothetical protein